jgi:Flp pilus assembly protein TadG
MGVFKNKRWNRTESRQRGVAVMEFTIVLPLMLFLIVAVSELGRAIMHYDILTQTVRDSARYVANNALRGQTQVVDIDAQLATEAGNLVAHGNILGTGPLLLPGIDPGSVTVTDEGGGDFSVTATYNYQPIFAPFLPDLLQIGATGGAYTMQAQVVMTAL